MESEPPEVHLLLRITRAGCSLSPLLEHHSFSTLCCNLSPCSIVPSSVKTKLLHSVLLMLENLPLVTTGRVQRFSDFTILLWHWFYVNLLT